MAKQKPETETFAYPVEDLIRASREAFGVKPEVAAGAFYGLSGEFTKEEAKEIIDNFLNKEVEA